jgi:hypothetical protein
MRRLLSDGALRAQLGAALDDLTTKDVDNVGNVGTG